MNLPCLALALALSLLLALVSYIQLLYHESLRLIKREAKSLEYSAIPSPAKSASIPNKAPAFFAHKAVSLPLIGLFFMCPGASWRSSMAGCARIGRLSVVAMLVAAYIVPHFCIAACRVTGCFTFSRS